MTNHCITSLFYLFVCLRVIQTQTYSEENLRNYNYQCGKSAVFSEKTSRVPWTATLYRRTEEVPDRVYAALIVDEYMVLMNANAFKLDSGELKIHEFSCYTVSVNVSRMDENHELNSAVQTVKVSHIQIHPGYNPLPWQWARNDIAVVYLETPLIFDSFVHPVCMPHSESFVKILVNSENKLPIFISGWTRYGTPENLLLKVNINHPDVCKNYWQNQEDTHKAPYVDRFCGNVSTENTHKTCIHRDNGVFRNFKGRFYFLGFVNNFYSDNRVCNENTREFICQLTESMLNFINDSARCGRYGNFACSNGACIPFTSVCDNTEDCGDGSDESNAICLTTPAYKKGVRDL